eukprot:6229251-Amphidinium_carterae.1
MVRNLETIVLALQSFNQAYLALLRFFASSVSSEAGITIGSGIVTDREILWRNYFLQPLQLPLPKKI